MAHPLRFFALALPNVAWPTLLARVRHVEAIGIETAGLADHFVDWTTPSRPWLESWTLLAALARETTRVRLATCVAQIPLRGPALLAHQALTVDHLSDGRLDLGLGIGLVSDPSCEMMGIPNWAVGERVARFGEYVEVVDRLLSNEVSSYEGEYYQVSEAVMAPGPVQRPRPPITIAAMGPRMLRHAARLADVWTSLSFAGDFEAQMAETAGRCERIDRICADIGRDPATLRRSYLMFDAGSRASGGRIDYFESETVFAERARRLMALGITEIGVYYPTVAEQAPKLEAIARDVLPELRAEQAAAG